MGATSWTVNRYSTFLPPASADDQGTPIPRFLSTHHSGFPSATGASEVSSRARYLRVWPRALQREGQLEVGNSLFLLVQSYRHPPLRWVGSSQLENQQVRLAKALRDQFSKSPSPHSISLFSTCAPVLPLPHCGADDSFLSLRLESSALFVLSFHSENFSD